MLAASSSSPTFVGIGESAFSKCASDVLSATNLGSCLGIAAYDPGSQVGGLIHCLLPLSQNDKEKAAAKPCLFVDTGLVYFLNQLIGMGAQKNNLKIVVAGGAAINDENHVFEIGKRNYTTLRKLLWKNNLLIAAEDTGGAHPRTLTLKMETGEVWLKALNEMKRLG